MNRQTTVALVAGKVMLGATLAMGLVTSAPGQAQAAPADQCQINLYSGQIDCSGQHHGADWDTDPGSYIDNSVSGQAGGK